MDFESIVGTVIGETDKAILLSEEHGAENWIPRSVIEDGDLVKVDESNEIELLVQSWFYEKELT